MNHLQKICPALLCCLALFFFQNCRSAKPATIADENPPAQGFDAANSDPAAVAIADEVMRAMGGRKAWDETRMISWNFFGSRTLVWDKWTGDVRIEWLKRPLKTIVNINSGAGKVWLNGAEQTHPDSLKKYLDIGKKVWINDSYWLVMPFKLKDSGVTLKYKGEAKTELGQPADLLQLTFAGVGVTPENKYLVWVDKQTRLVSQWAFFEKFLDVQPRFINPWTDYQPHGRVLLSGSRGEQRSLMPIEVSEKPAADVFDRF